MRRPASAAKILLGLSFALAALAPAARANDTPSLPYCSSTSLGGALAAFDSVLAGVDVVWEVEPNDVEKAALAAALQAEATRRGYVIGDAESKTRWVLTRRGPATEGQEEGDPPLTPAGNAAALADLVRRASPRSMMPTQASLQLAVKKFNVAIWTGEARIDPDPADPAASAEVAVRGLVALVPRFGRVPLTFHRAARDSVVAYYTDHLQGRWFFCPALPYAVRFPDLERAYHQGGRTLRWESTVNSHEHEDGTILPACLDLILHAKSALPKPVPGFVDVKAAELWRDVTLVDVYRDETGAEVNVEVHLRGDTRGYKVDETRVLNAGELAKHNEEMARFEDSAREVFKPAGR